MSSADVPDSDNKVLLSDETLAALQLRCQPFEAEVDTNALFTDEVTAEQLADIRHALITGDDLLLVFGEQGAGKSTLLAQLAANSGLRIQCFSVKGGQRFSTRNLFIGMLEAFKVRPPENLKEALDELVPCLQAMLGNNTLCVVVLDDADKVDETELTRLLNGMQYINNRDESLLRVTFAALPEFEQRIPDLIPEGTDLPYSSFTIDPFTAPRASAYLDYRLTQASENPRARTEPEFNPEDVAALNEHARGLPAALNAAAASVLDARHNPAAASLVDVEAPEGSDSADLYSEELPPELREETEFDAVENERAGWLGSRWAKIALGALALLLILGGLTLTGGGPDRDNADEPEATVTGSSTAKIATEREAQRLELLREQATDGSTNTADASTATGEASTVLPAPIAESDDTATGDASETPGPTDDGGLNAGDDSSESGTEVGAGAEAAAGDPSSDPNAESGQDAGQSAQAESDVENGSETGVEANAETGAETDAEPGARNVAKADAETAAEVISETESASAADVETSGAGERLAIPQRGNDNDGDAGAAITGNSQAANEGAGDATDDGPGNSPDNGIGNSNDNGNGADPVSDESLLGTDTSADVTDAAPSTSADADTNTDASTGTDNDGAGDGDGDGDGDGTDAAAAGDESLEESLAEGDTTTPIGALESPNWILVQTPGQWTVQMSASTDRESVEQFLERSDLPAPNSIYQFERNGRTWFALVHGLFPSIPAARAAIEQMSAEATSNQPWIRAVDRIQAALRESN